MVSKWLAVLPCRRRIRFWQFWVCISSPCLCGFSMGTPTFLPESQHIHVKASVCACACSGPSDPFKVCSSRPPWGHSGTLNSQMHLLWTIFAFIGNFNLKQHFKKYIKDEMWVHSLYKLSITSFIPLNFKSNGPARTVCVSVLYLQSHIYYIWSTDQTQYIKMKIYSHNALQLSGVIGGPSATLVLLYHMQDALWQSFNVAVCVGMCSQSLQKFSHALLLQHAAVMWS